MADHIDVKFKSWGNGSKSGPWIKLDLAEEEDLEALKNQIGNGFHMVLVPIDQGDSRSSEDTVTTEIAAEKVEERHVVMPAPSVEGKKEKPLSCQAHFMVEQKSFWDYSNELYSSTISSYEDADRHLKVRLHIDTKTDLDKGNLYLQNTFLGIQSNWRRWVNSRERRY